LQVRHRLDRSVHVVGTEGLVIAEADAQNARVRKEYASDQ
jgi:hypothetical protein